MSSEIIMRHWREGGTGITNLSDDHEVIAEAIRRYGDPNLVIHDQAWGPAAKDCPGWKSLHWLNRPETGCNLSAFWAIVRELEKADSAPTVGDK